ncbi:hypothetical protein [Thiocapsa roseopersicina]|uniref:Uncharacterized protein n=1 Tax=Thiocapsa roseopersicina TaxID=1058 RepID=A0A1H2SUD5_THIRO|nr:hypothetical protein [Thiocapsa roseopersicina]SDW35261.1 hypothetical protein SAMN05421783_103154 [Thiocapsa roseopersicina]
MIKQPSDADLERIDAAFNRALAAEASARESVEACRIEADRLLAEAEGHARRLVERTDRRLLAVQRIADTSLQHALSELLGRVAEPLGDGLGAAADTRLNTAIDTLAEEMIGAGADIGGAVGPRDREGGPS